MFKGRDGAALRLNARSSKHAPPTPGRAGVSDFAAILPSKMGAILAIGGSLPTVVQKADGRWVDRPAAFLEVFIACVVAVACVAGLLLLRCCCSETGSIITR